jgi:alpha,alpha-trehalose phosphorylase
MQYWYATGDLEYMSHKGAEVLVETARLWLDAGHYDTQERFLIHTVTGPDEYTCMINNNYYTNRCAQANLSGAAEICKALRKEGMAETIERATGITPEEIELFEHAAAAMWFPYDSERDIHAQDDSFLSKPVWDLSTTPQEKLPLLLHYHPLYLYRHQVCKQADTVLAHILFDDGVEESTKRNSYNYYESITTHDSSLSRCAFSIMATRLGMEKKAYDYFMDTLRTDLDDTHGNTKDGLHTANLGGSWLSMVLGFAGMRLDKDGLHFRCQQPDKWESTTLRIRYLGRLIKVRMERGKAEFTLEEGEPVCIYVDSKQLCLD